MVMVMVMAARPRAAWAPALREAEVVRQLGAPSRREVTETPPAEQLKERAAASVGPVIVWMNPSLEILTPAPNKQAGVSAAKSGCKDTAT